MDTKNYHLKITFLTPVLGSQPTVDVASEFIASKFVENGGELPEDEAKSLPENLERGTTVFHRLNGEPIFYDYQVKGFIKEAGRTFNGLRGVKNMRSKIDNLVFITPRQIPIHLADGSTIEFLERPLRAETAQGPRVALARSEMIAEGSWFECDLEVFESQIKEDLLRDLLSYGSRKGMGQWRNGSWGQFSFVLV